MPCRWNRRSTRSSSTPGNAAVESIERGKLAIEVGAGPLDRELDIAQLVLGHDHGGERVLSAGEPCERSVDALASRRQELLLVQRERLGQLIGFAARALVALVEHVGHRRKLGLGLGLLCTRALEVRAPLAALDRDL